MSLLLSLLKILESILAVAQIRAKWELERDIENYCDDLERRIETARDMQTPEGDRIADRLHDRLLRSSGIAVSERRDFTS